MCTNALLYKRKIISDYQYVTNSQFLVDKKLGEMTDFSVSLHCMNLVIDRMNGGLPETSGACVQLSVSERLNAFLSSCPFSIYISAVLDI